MSPYEQIRTRSLLAPDNGPFEEYLLWHLVNGFVYATPQFFIMGLPVNRAAVEQGGLPLDQLVDPLVAKDAWYISAMAGDLAKCWSILPYELPWIGFQREHAGEKVLSFHPSAQIRRLCIPGLTTPV